MKTSLTGTLYDLLEGIRGSHDATSLDAFAKAIEDLKARSDDAKRQRVDHFIANHLLELPEENEMTPALRHCVDTCLDGAWQYKTKAMLLQKNLEELCGIELSNLDGTSGALLSREPTSPDKLRASFFNARGFHGDMNRANPHDVLHELWQDGIRYLSPGLLQKMSVRREWSEGSASTLDIQQVNLGNLPFQQYQQNARCRQQIKNARDVLWQLMRQHQGQASFSEFVQVVRENFSVIPAQKLFDALCKDLDAYIPPEEGLFDSVPEPAQALFWYGLKARPASPGAVPAGFCRQMDVNEAQTYLTRNKLVMDASDYRHGMIAYSQALPPSQVSAFELKIPFDNSRPPAPPGDLSDPVLLKQYALTLHRGGWITRDALMPALKEPSAIRTLVEDVLASFEKKETRAVSCRI